MTFTPSHAGAPSYTPACCFVCGRRAEGLGMGFRSRGDDPKWLCEECIELGSIISKVKRFDVFEDRALSAVIEKVGPLVEQFGSDLGEWDMDQVEEFVASVVMGFGNCLRDEIKKSEAPF